MDGAEGRIAGALAAGWSLAAAALREPGPELEAVAADPAFVSEADALLGAVPAAGGPCLARAWDRFRAAFAARGAAGLAGERARALGHAVRGPCPPYELEYGPEHFLGKSHRLGDIAAFYRAFGVDVSRAARERPDHVAVEAEFLSLVALKRFLALREGRADRAAICRDAERAFLEDHLGRFLPSFARRVAGREPGGALAAAAALAETVARVHAAAVGARLGSPDAELREIGTVEEETVVSCGAVEVPGGGCTPGEPPLEV
jgi:hypothetical protein